jgi:glycosyltransferase involved in cell wall biosynthesis
MVTSFMLGRPVVCTECDATRDYVRDGVNGLLVGMSDPMDVREKLMRLASDEALYIKLCAGAREWAEQNADPVVYRNRINAIVSRVV